MFTTTCLWLLTPLFGSCSLEPSRKSRITAPCAAVGTPFTYDEHHLSPRLQKVKLPQCTSSFASFINIACCHLHIVPIKYMLVLASLPERLVQTWMKPSVDTGWGDVKNIWVAREEKMFASKYINYISFPVPEKRMKLKETACRSLHVFETHILLLFTGPGTEGLVGEHSH